MESPAPKQRQTKGDLAVSRGVRRRMQQIIASLVVQAAVLFISSGRLDWGMAWVFMAVQVGAILINAWIVLPTNPGLIAERAEIRKDTRTWDRVIMTLYLLTGIVMLALAGLDKRFGWSSRQVLTTELVALLLVALGLSLVSWAMISNPFFSSMVRIQRDRGHKVATAGPYQYVRHPGYVGIIMTLLATPLMLGSHWALIPAGLAAALFVIRTSLEDKILHNELGGYSEYAGRVRYRLLPGVW
jgi:protein-S-isoprenylcysteine O-methyltransferase Ste14